MAVAAAATAPCAALARLSVDCRGSASPAGRSPSTTVAAASLRSSDFLSSGVHASSSSVVFSPERISLVKTQAIGSQRRPARGQTLVVRGLFGLGVPELAVIAGVAAILFGPKKLPEIGKSLGQTVKSFQKAAKEFESEIKSGAAAVAQSDSTESTTKIETPETPVSSPPPSPSPPSPPAPTAASTPSEKDSA